MTMAVWQLQITDAEFQERCGKLAAYIDQEKADGIVLFDSDYVRYYTGFAFIPTERPIAFYMNAKGERGLFVPRLEVSHAEAHAVITQVASYPEYPGDTHPMQVLVDTMRVAGIEKEILADNDGYPWIFGYRGESLSAMGYTVRSPRVFIEDAMAVKSPMEIELLKESCRWGNLAHVLLQRYTAVGVTETEVEQRCSEEATAAMKDAVGWLAGSGGRAHAGYRGQIGRNASVPHALGNNIVFQAGDVLVTGASASIRGYVSELERTMFMGAPTDEQKYLFDHMVALQDLAMDAIVPGKPCSEVDKEVRAYFDENDLMKYWKHHTGHTIGLRYHEGPFLDTGDDTVILPGMVFTVEPGLYDPAIGGFRHSDTLVVTEDGTESITYYPRDLQSLIIPV